MMIALAAKQQQLLLLLVTVLTLTSTLTTHGFSVNYLQRDRVNHRSGAKQPLVRSLSENDDNVDSFNADISPIERVVTKIKDDPTRSIYFSLMMTFCGAALGPFLDSYHSLFGVLTYNTPIVLPILGSIGKGPDLLTCVTSLWVPPLFGLAGFIIGWLYIILDTVTTDGTQGQLHPTPSKVLLGISYFTFQYWLSGILFSHGVDRSSILTIMSLLAAGGFYLLDGTTAGFVTSAATAIGGPLIEVGLISSLPESWAYHYNDVGETGFFPLWIVPVYFLGGPANGNLARGFWNALGSEEETTIAKTFGELLGKDQIVPCSVCLGTRAVKCPNCDDGTFVTYGERVVCNACRGKGRVICRDCFSKYGDDPADIENIRRIMDRIPD